jgi:hypothetical protein
VPVYPAAQNLFEPIDMALGFRTMLFKGRRQSVEK